MPFTTGVPQDLRRTVAVPLVFASLAGLLACPQLLQDDFGSALDTSGDDCERRRTCGGTGGAAGASAGAAGTTSGTGGSSSAGGATSGTSGASGASGEAGAGADGGTGGDPPDASAGPGFDPPDASTSGPDCWKVALNDTTHVASNNCLGIHGWNDVETDPGSDTVVTSSYLNGEVCLEGTIDASGWGAIFNLTFANEAAWDAVAAGVGGFQFEHTGSSLPPEVRVIYVDDDAGDFCRIITPAVANAVPFSDAHPGCASGGAAVTDATDLTFIRLALPPKASDYTIDYCLTIRAIP